MQVKVTSIDGRESGCVCRSWDKWEEEDGSIVVSAGGREFKIPQDGDAIWIENDEGRTINSWKVAGR